MSASIASAKEANERYSTYFLTSCQYLFRGNPYFKLNNFLIVSEVIKTLLFVEILLFFYLFPTYSQKNAVDCCSSILGTILILL